MSIREWAERIVDIVRGADSGAAVAAVQAELAASSERSTHDAMWQRQLAALLELARGQEREQWSLAEATAHITQLAVDTLGVARMGAWLFDPGHTQLVCANMFEAGPRTHSHGAVLARAEFPRYFASLSDARVIAVEDACHDPRSVEFADIYFAPHGVVSTLDAPIRWQGVPVGVLCCEHVGALRSWRDDEIGFIASLADAATLALEADRRRTTEQALIQKLAVIESQQAAIHRLSSPVLEVWDGVLAVPMIGSFDDERRVSVMMSLLNAVTQRRARWVLLDLTGVDTVDTATADALVRLVRAVGLLGARCVISGIDPLVAQTMVSLEADLRGIVTASNLKTGLQHCLQAGAHSVGARSQARMSPGAK